MDKITMQERLKAHLQRLQSTQTVPLQEVNVELISRICALVGIPKDCLELCVQIFSYKPRTKIVWLHMAECTGCSESFLRLDKPGVESLLLEYISLEYHETIMGAVGFAAKESLHNALQGEFILVIEGGVSLGEKAYFMTSGADSITGEEECKHIAAKAQAIFAVGTCSSFGGVQAAIPNPTDSVGVDTFLSQKVVNIPGCPPSEANIIGSLIYFILLNELPELDSLNRPLWSYGKNLHDLCERKAKFESGDFAQSFDDPHLRDGYCLYKVGCKGPYVANNCPKVKFNTKTSWPVRAGHGCIACSEPHFWDSFGHIEEPLNNANAYIREDKHLSRLAHIHNDESDSYIPDGTLILALYANAPTRIYIKGLEYSSDDKNSENIESFNNLLQCRVQTHFPALLDSIRNKNKPGARLVENYIKWRTQMQFSDLQSDATQAPSQNIADILPLIAQMFGQNYDVATMLDMAEAYLFPYPSKLDMKLSGTDVCQIDIDRSLRLPLCYLLGGLEIEGVAYGAIWSICEILSNALITLAKSHNIEKIAFKGDAMSHALVQDNFYTHLPKWLQVV